MCNTETSKVISRTDPMIFSPYLCSFDEGYEQTTFHKLTGWGNWLRTNQHYLWGNPTSGGGGPLK